MDMLWYRRTINGRGRGRGMVAVRQAVDCEPRRAVALEQCAESLWQAAPFFSALFPLEEVVLTRAGPRDIHMQRS